MRNVTWPRGMNSSLDFAGNHDRNETTRQRNRRAEQLEKKRDAAREAATRASEHGGRMGTAIAIFQIAIAMGSICIVTKKRPLWYLALAFAALATAQMIQVWVR